MASLREIVDELADDIGAWNDESIKEQLRFSFKHHCARYIRQTIDKNRRIDQNFLVDAPCVKVTKADRAECCDISSQCDVLRTEKLPDPIRLTHFFGITYVGSIDKFNRTDSHFPLVEPAQVPFIAYEKWTANKPRAYWIDNRIYLANVPSVLDRVYIQMIPGDPEKLGSLTGCDEKCFTIDSPYPASDDVIDLVMKDMLQGKLKLYMTPPINRDNEINQEGLSSSGEG